MTPTCSCPQIFGPAARAGLLWTHGVLCRSQELWEERPERDVWCVLFCWRTWWYTHTHTSTHEINQNLSQPLAFIRMLASDSVAISEHYCGDKSFYQIFFFTFNKFRKQALISTDLLLPVVGFLLGYELFPPELIFFFVKVSQ